MTKLLMQLILLTSIIPFCSVSAQRINWNLDNQSDAALHACRFVYAQGKAEIRPDLGNNSEILAQLDSFVRAAVVTHSDMHIGRIRLSGYSSIEGTYAINERLAYERAEYFREYLEKRYPELRHYPVDMMWVPEDWDGLSRAVRELRINEWEEVREIIRKTRSYEERKVLLKKMNGGITYREIERTILPELRRVEIKIEYTTASPQPSPKEREQEDGKDIDTPQSEEEHKEQLAHEVEQDLPDSGLSQPKPYRFALKTNLLLWTGVQHNLKHTTPVANVALEYYINAKWSVELYAKYSYWRYNSNREFQGISGYLLEPRYWILPSDSRVGLFVGVYGRVGDYDRRSVDFQRSEEDGYNVDGQLNYTGDYWDAGVSAGVFFQLIGPLGLEVGARMGYLDTNAIKYTKENRYNWFESRHSYSKIKVTDLNVNLIYRFR